MCDIFAGSYVSISASAADSTAGIFTSRNPLSTMPCEITPSWIGFDVRPLTAVPTYRQFGEDFDPLAGFPLYKKGLGNAGEAFGAASTTLHERRGFFLGMCHEYVL